MIVDSTNQLPAPAMQLPAGLSIKRWRRHFPITSPDSLVNLLAHLFSPASSITIAASPPAPPEPNLTFISLILGFFEHKLTCCSGGDGVSTSLSSQNRRRRINSGGSSKGNSSEVDATEERRVSLSIDDGDIVEDRLLPAKSPSTAKNQTEFPVLTFEKANQLYTDFVALIAPLKTSNVATKDTVTTATEDNDTVALSGRPVIQPLSRGTGSHGSSLRKLITAVSNLLWNRLSSNSVRDKSQSHGQSIYSLLNDSNLDSFGMAFTVVAACQILGSPEVHLALSEDHAWVQFGTETAEVAWNGRSNEDKRGLPVSTGISDRSWLYLNGHPVVCRSKSMACAAAVTAINPIVSPVLQSLELALVKHRLLWILYEAKSLTHYPLALLNLAELEESQSLSGNYHSESPLTPISLYKEGVSAARKYYADQHIYPYMFTAGHLFRCGRYAETLHYWAEAARVISYYNYTKEDHEIYKEFHEVAYTQLPNLMRLSVTASPPVAQDPLCLAAVLRFIDGLCRWEEGSTTPVLHVGWANKLMATLIRFDPVARAGLPELMTAASKSEEGEVGKETIIVEDVKEEHPLIIGGAPMTSLSAELAAEELDWSSSSCTSVVSPQELTAPLEVYDLESLARACELRVLNPEFLLGCTVDPFLPADTDPPPISPLIEQQRLVSANTPSVVPPSSPVDPPSQSLCFASAKMAGIQHLLSAAKLNASAIKLQLTAQSQVSMKRTDLSNAYGLPRKRTRRN